MEIIDLTHLRASVNPLNDSLIHHDIFLSGTHANINPKRKCCLPNSDGAKFYFAREQRDSDLIFTKKYYSAFRGDSSLHEKLQSQDVGTLVISGVMTHVCVLVTALDALALGYQVLVANDAVSSSKPHYHYEALYRMRSAGIKLTTATELLSGPTSVSLPHLGAGDCSLVYRVFDSPSRDTPSQGNPLS